MLKKYLKISLLLILFIFIFLFEKVDYTVHSYIIDNIYMDDNSKNIVDYIGYIEIDRLMIKREIVKGINTKNLISHVTLDDSCDNLECSNIILAGHSTDNIFGRLKNIKIDDIVKITSIEDTYYYKVIDYKIVDKKDINAIDNSDLILITCYDFNRRIIIKAKKI